MKCFDFNPFEEKDAFLRLFLREPRYEMEIHSSRPAILLIPGGAYRFVADREEEPVALFFVQAGYQVCALHYSTRTDPSKEPLGTTPLVQAAKTICLMRENCQSWGIDPNRITVCGFSAGGHLAASLGTLWHDSSYIPFASEKCRPNGMILSYPVICANEYRHKESIANLTGYLEDHPENQLWSLENMVSEKTCPAFLWHTMEDQSVPVMNSILFAKRMQSVKVPCALHMFTHGRHGISIGDHETGGGNFETASWSSLALSWLDSMSLGPMPERTLEK